MTNTKASRHRPLPEPEARELARSLRHRRERLGMTQEGLAVNAQVSVQMIRRLEAATANPTLGTLHAVATALDIAWTELMIEVQL